MSLLRQSPQPRLQLPRNHPNQHWFGLLVIMMTALGILQLSFPATVARAAAYPCTEAGLDTALTSGGFATFSCTVPTTITLTTAKTVSVSGTVLDGVSLLTLDGRNVANSMFYVPGGITATFQNMAFNKGQGQVSAANYYGGAIFTRGTVSVSNAIFSNNGISNGPDMYGGAIYSESSLTVQNSTFYGNQGYFGAAISAFYSDISISNSTFSANLGLEAVRMSGNIDNSTFYGNSNYDLIPTNTVNVKNSIVGEYAVGLNDLGNNLLGGTPLLNPLTNNGGFVPTMSLQACSPAINAGNSTGAPATDERGSGFPRILQGAIDIGAFESNLLPCLSVNDVSLNEGNTGTTAFNFTVSLSAAASTTILVNYATVDGTATTTDNDYLAASGTLTFPPGMTSQTINVLVKGDTKAEPNETFTVTLSNPTGATLVIATGTGTIVNDDSVPAISIGDVSQAEGNAGITAFALPVTLSAASTQNITIQYITADDTATVADNDYVAASGTLTIPAGQTSVTIFINVNGDIKVEPNETFTVTLSNPSGASLGTSVATGTILNDDGVPSVTIGDVSQKEGNAGTTAFNFPVTLSAISSQLVTVNYATMDGTATTADNDYTAATGTLSFPAGQTTSIITVNVNGDTKIEPDEVFSLNLSGPTNATLSKATATGTILVDDVAPPPMTTPTLSVGDVRQREGNSSTTVFNFTVRLSVSFTGTVTVNYATADDTATIADKDYQSTSGKLSFAPGETVKTVTVLVSGDTKVEPDEVFFLVLTNPVGANLGKGTAQGVILNDDSQVDEADLIGKLRVMPDREFDLAGGDGNLLTYVLVVKNIGMGASSPVAVQLPIDSNLAVAYAAFSTDSVPGAFYEKTVTDTTTAVLPYAVLPYAQLRLPALAPGQSVTATIAMRAIAGAKSGELTSRFTIVWDNLDGKPHHYYSNRVHIHLGNGTTRNETSGLVQFLAVNGEGNGLDAQGRATVRLRGDIYAPGERVYLWYTDGNGKSTDLGYVWCDQYTGELNALLTIPGWQSGQRYFLAALGDRSGVIGSATTLVQAKSATQGLVEDSSGSPGGYTYTEVAPLFDSATLQSVLKALTAGQ